MDKDTSDKSKSGKDSSGGTVKIPESFQQEVGKLINSATSLPMLDYIGDEVRDAEQKMRSSQKKNGMNTNNFSLEDGPVSY